MLNGEKTQMNFNTLMYGIGYNDWPFFEFRNFGETTDIRPYNYYRKDRLLWGEEYNPSTSATLPRTEGIGTPYHDL